MHKPFKPKRLRRPSPSLPSVPAIRVVSFNTAKSQNTPAAILHFLNEGYDIILLQELNSPPLLPQRYAFGNDRAKVFSNVCGHRHGVSVIAGPRIARYTSCVPPRDSDGLICGAKISLPEATPLHVFSVYSPPVRTGAPAPYRDTIQRVLASHFNDHPNHTLGGDFNCVLDPELDQHSLVDLHEWHWLTGEVEYIPARLVDTFRSEHPSLRQYTRYASDRWDSEARLDYIFASPRLVSHFPFLDASVLTDYTISDHHPVVAVFQCPSLILPSQPPLPPAFFGSFLVTKSNNSPTAYGSSPTGAGTSRTPLPGPHWKRLSPPLTLSLCKLGLRTTESRVRSRGARTKRATASSGNYYAHPRLLLPQHFPSTLRKFSPW